MFTRKKLPQIPSGDVDALAKAIVEHFRSLEEKGALAINQITKWTPSLTIATPGDLSVVYSARTGRIVRQDDKLVTAFFRIVTSTFTFTTATGDLQITGLPAGYTAATESGFSWAGSVIWSGITKAGYTQVNPRVLSADNKIVLSASGSGVATATVGHADTPSGGTISLIGCVTYEVE